MNCFAPNVLPQLFVSALAVAMPTALPAAEPSTGVPLPGLQSDPPNTVFPEECAVSVVAGHVSMVMSVSTGEDQPALLFQGPLFGWNGPSDPYPDRNFPELQFRIDGEAAKSDEYYEAFVGKRNISVYLKMAGMDPWAITRTPPLTAAHTKHVQLPKMLAAMGAVEESGDEYLAKWQARRMLRIPLKAAAVQHVQIDYTARPATAVDSAEQLDSEPRDKSYCLAPAQLRRLVSRRADSRFMVSEFTLPTGIDGKPARSVTLTISAGPGAAGGPRAYFLLCGLHGKLISKRGALDRERAEVDEHGALHVLRVESAEPPPH
jgi:hypothetical protein